MVSMIVLSVVALFALGAFMVNKRQEEIREWVDSHYHAVLRSDRVTEHHMEGFSLIGIAPDDDSTHSWVVELKREDAEELERRGMSFLMGVVEEIIHRKGSLRFGTNVEFVLSERGHA